MIYSNQLLPGLSLLFCLLISPVFSQPSFQKVYGNDQNYLYPANVIAVSDGYVLSGYSISPEFSSAPALMKISPAGDVLWQKHYELNEAGSFNQVVKANDGGLLAVGIKGFGTEAFLVVKTDDDGNLLWQKLIHSYQDHRRNIEASVMAVDGGYIILGGSKKNSIQQVLIRIDNQGETIWSKRYPAATYAYNFQMLAGFASGDTVFASGHRDSLATFGLFDAATGNVLSSAMLESPVPGDKRFYSIVPAANGDFLMAGNIPAPASPSEQWVCRMSRTGDLKWSKRYPANRGGRIIAMSDDHFLLSAYFNGGQADRKAALTKIDGEGQVVWSYLYGNAGEAELNSAVETPDGGVLAVGLIYFPSTLYYRLLIVKTDKNGLVTGCCRQPIDQTAMPSPVQQTPQGLTEVPFDNGINIGVSQQDDTLQQLDYCPALQMVINVEVALCPGDSVVIDGTVYTTMGVVTSFLPGAECDTAIIYDIKINLQPSVEKTVSFCPGDSVTVGGTVFTQPGVFTQAVPSVTGGCDTLITYTLQYSADIPTLAKTVSFCPGDSVTVGGTTYHQPAVVTLTLPSTTGGCDTLATYTLVYTTPPSPTALALNCPADISVSVPAGVPSVLVNYLAPTVQSDCPCPGSDVLQTQGLTSGSDFPTGVSTLCYAAQDNCGNQATCCFQINVVEEEDSAPCDVKVNGCLKFELLRITRDVQGRRTYYLRIQNNCSQALTYVAFGLPAGVTAYAPLNGTSYSAPNGQSYTVRNPNSAPVHSIRFSAQNAGIQSGESDVFQYTLPPYSAPDYIHALVKLNGQPYVETHLNTFSCPVQSDPAASNRNAGAVVPGESIFLFPNPAEKVLFVDLQAWSASSAQIRVFNVQGQVVLSQETGAALPLVVPLDLPAGIYLLEVRGLPGNQREIQRFVVR